MKGFFSKVQSLCLFSCAGFLFAFEYNYAWCLVGVIAGSW